MFFLQTLYGQTRKVILHRKTQGKKQPDKFSPIGFKAKQSGNQTPVVGAEGSDEWSDGSYPQSLHKELSDLELSIPQVKRSAQGRGVCDKFCAETWVSISQGRWRALQSVLGIGARKTPPSTKTKKKKITGPTWKPHNGVVVFDGFCEIRVRIKLTIRKPINVGAPWCHMSWIKQFPKSL